MKGKESWKADADMQNATTALIRAAKRARELAAQTGTEIVVIRDGKLVREIPLMEENPKRIIEKPRANDQGASYTEA